MDGPLVVTPPAEETEGDVVVTVVNAPPANQEANGELAGLREAVLQLTSRVDSMQEQLTATATVAGAALATAAEAEPEPEAEPEVTELEVPASSETTSEAPPESETAQAEHNRHRWI